MEKKENKEVFYFVYDQYENTIFIYKESPEEYKENWKKDNGIYFYSEFYPSLKEARENARKFALEQENQCKIEEVC